ncbi:8235_t:CDS:2, partial [Paraglomus brasilianum]
MDNIRDRAKYLVDNAIKGTILDENGNKVEHPDKGKPANGHRIEYSFGDDYTKNDGSPVAANNFTHTELEQLFNLMKLFGDTLILLPAEEKPIPSSKFKLEEFGIEGYIDNNGNSNFYATDYGTRISDGSEYRPQLFADLRSYDTTSSTGTDKGGTGTDITPNYDIFTDGTNHFAYQEFPEFYLDQEGRLTNLQADKDIIAEQMKSGQQELKQAEKDYQAARKQLFAKEKELDNKITAKITELRQELKEKYKVSDTEANDFAGDNKITTDEHFNFRRLVEDIRFLVNNDDQKPTGKTNEDQACQKKLVKLSERETEIKTALKAAIDNQKPEETIKDWQNNLKTIETGLETAFTEEK